MGWAPRGALTRGTWSCCWQRRVSHRLLSPGPRGAAPPLTHTPGPGGEARGPGAPARAGSASPAPHAPKSPQLPLATDRKHGGTPSAPRRGRVSHFTGWAGGGPSRQASGMSPEQAPTAAGWPVLPQHAPSTEPRLRLRSPCLPAGPGTQPPGRKRGAGSRGGPPGTAAGARRSQEAAHSGSCPRTPPGLHDAWRVHRAPEPGPPAGERLTLSARCEGVTFAGSGLKE